MNFTLEKKLKAAPEKVWELISNFSYSPGQGVGPEKSFSYSIIKGTPTRTYKGRGQIEKSGDGTVITWSGDFVPMIPFTGALIRMIAKKSVSAYLDAVLSKGGMLS